MPRAVVFKQEGEIDGEPYGPARVTNFNGRSANDPTGVPYRTLCTCKRPKGDPDSDCRDCGNWIEPEWVRRSTAQAKANLLGLPLKEV